MDVTAQYALYRLIIANNEKSLYWGGLPSARWRHTRCYLPTTLTILACSLARSMVSSNQSKVTFFFFHKKFVLRLRLEKRYLQLAFTQLKGSFIDIRYHDNNMNKIGHSRRIERHKLSWNLNWIESRLFLKMLYGFSYTKKPCKDKFSGYKPLRFGLDKLAGDAENDIFLTINLVATKLICKIISTLTSDWLNSWVCVMPLNLDFNFRWLNSWVCVIPLCLLHGWLFYW